MVRLHPPLPHTTLTGLLCVQPTMCAPAVLAGRTAWLAIYSQPGEEELLGKVHRQVAAGSPGLLTIIVPRDGSRCPEVERVLSSLGLSVCMWGNRETSGAAEA